MNGLRLVIRGRLSAAELRRRARQGPDRAAAARMMAIANALEGMTRAEAARLAGMERQALRDAVLRDSAEGRDGLHDRPRPGARPRLDDAQMAQLRQIVWDGPDVEKTGLSAWTLAELCGEVKRRWTVSSIRSSWSKVSKRYHERRVAYAGAASPCCKSDRASSYLKTKANQDEDVKLGPIDAKLHVWIDGPKI